MTESRDAQGREGVPKRIQLSRKKGWRKPEGAVVVARPTRWGNPFRVGSRVQASPSHPVAVCFSAAQAVEAYRAFLEHPVGARFRRDAIEALRGHDLACWCPLDQPCHADVLLDLANTAALRATPRSGDGGEG